METRQTSTTLLTDDYDAPNGLSDAERRQRMDETVWRTLGTLWRRRFFIAGVTGAVAVLTVVISLLLPNWYRAEARLLLPTRSGAGMLAGALSELPSSAKSLLGGVSGDYARYLTILSSRSVAERAVDQFDLVEVYETGDSETARLDAMLTLWENTELAVDEEYEFLTVAVLDTDPERAAALTNFFIDELTRVNGELSAATAANYRRYIEARYEESEAGLDSVFNALRDLQERYGVMDLAVQGEAFYTSLAALRLQIFQAQAQYEQLSSEYGPDNSIVRAAQQALATANRQYNQALEGEERLMPVAQDSLPAVARQFIELQKEQLILSKLVEYTRPLLEQARFEEQRQIEAVQVVDAAVPPQRKARPKRSIICIVATLSAFILAVLFVLIYDWWRRNFRTFALRLQREAAEGA